MSRLQDRVAVITGAGRGIGREIALLMASQGAKIVVNDLGANTDGTGSTMIADDVVAEIKATGGEAVSNTDSVADVAGGERLIQTAIDAFGGMDILVNNAGILRDRTIFKMEESDWDAVLAVHLKGHYCCTRPFANYIRAENRTGCRIINFSSVSGLFGNFGQANYAAAKAGIAVFMRCLWLEGVKYGITVNVLAPTATSRLTTDILPEEVQENFPPEAVSPPVVWLCTDEAKDISGRQWLVAGNNVSLLSWQLTPIAQASADAEPWAVADIGEKILASKDQWPPVNPLRGG